MKKVLKITGIILLVLLILIAGYVAYLFGSYHRIDDMQDIQVLGNGKDNKGVTTGKELQVTSWNIGFTT